MIGGKIKEAYDFGGLRDFDRGFMARVYERPFEVESVPLDKAPKDHEAAEPVGRHLEGCRIGFDAGGSDRKVSAVIDGEPVFRRGRMVPQDEFRSFVSLSGHPRRNEDRRITYAAR